MTSNSQILALFPGQGSQKVGMGKALYEKFDLARRHFELADKVLGLPLSKICFEGPAEDLTKTEIAQPAILTLSYICYLLRQQAPGKSFQICAAAGHSLGEYTALLAAQALRFEDAVGLVHKRGRFMQEAVPVGAGKMLAVLGKESEEIGAALAQVKNGIVQIANINAPGQIVIAGDAGAVDQAVTHLGGAKTIALAVSAPFHCALMKPAEEKLWPELQKIEIARAQFPIYCNFSASAVSEPEQIRQALRRQVCGTVRWVECMQNAITQSMPALAVEFGESNVLSGMLKRIKPELERVQIGRIEDF